MRQKIYLKKQKEESENIADDELRQKLDDLESHFGTHVKICGRRRKVISKREVAMLMKKAKLI